jgi:RHH-type proline utilization regulon transcriptional repressor/proline dehydrogenase/delta 1-pyrroline-5-carboxylate dehydrogenase
MKRRWTTELPETHMPKRPAETMPPPFAAPYAPDDAAMARSLLAGAGAPPETEAAIDATARALIGAIRARSAGIGGVEEILREYALSTKEGLALMVLAEALLRVPDAATADRLIEDKLGRGDFSHHETKSDALLVSASAWALSITSRIIQPGETPASIVAGLAKRIGLPAVRTATRQAMRVMGNHFVLGETIEAALKRARSGSRRLARYSFDMLGEGARTGEDARRYFASYAKAIEAIGKAAGNAALPDRPGISVKLSALHPRYEATSHERVMTELVPRVVELARMAKARDLNFTVDAEEADRLELSLDVIAAVAADPSLGGWEGFGSRHPGLSEARSRGDRLGRPARRGARPALHGAPRQGRLLGYRDQARPGARPCRLSGLHPQGHDRLELYGLRREAPVAAPAHLPADRHP